MPARSQQEQPRPDSTPLSRAGGGESSPAVEQRAGGRRARAAMLLRSSSGLCKKHPPCLQSRVYSAIKRAYWVVHDAATTLFLALQAKLDLCFSKILPVLCLCLCAINTARPVTRRGRSFKPRLGPSFFLICEGLVVPFGGKIFMCPCHTTNGR